MVASTKFFLASLKFLALILVRSVPRGQGKSGHNAPEMSGKVREFKLN